MERPEEDVWQLARRIGIDVDDARARELLTRPELTGVEIAELLRRSRSSISEAHRGGHMEGARRQMVGKRAVYWTRPLDVLRWALARPKPVDRFVDRELAERYAAEDGRTLED